MSTRARIEEDLQHTDLDFFAALLDRDMPTLEELLAEDFLIVDLVSATVHPRAAFLDAVGAGTVIFHEIETFPYERTIRLFSADTGIVVGRTTMSFTGPEGTRLMVGSRYTHVLRAHDQTWQLVSAQGTPIPAPDETP